MKLILIHFIYVVSFLSFGIMAADNTSTDPSETPSRKRTSSESVDVLHPNKKQVFARATYDCTAKYVLSDNEIRLDFLQTFVNSDIRSSESLDLSLNPLKTLSNIRELLNHSNNKKFMSWVKSKPTNYKVMEGELVSETGTAFMRDLSKSFDDLVKTFPSEKDARLDILCHLSSGDYSLVEIQVKKQDFWDDRALAYVCSVYGNQLSVGGKWANLKKVIGINILGGGPSNVKYWGKNDRPFRHYVVQDKYNSEHVIKGVELIQYSLGDIKWNDEKIRDNKNLKDWLEYFKDAHTKEKIPEDVSPPLKKAYEKIMFDKIPDEIKKDYESEAASFENLTDYTKSVKEETKREMALKMIADGVSVENVSKYTELSLDEVKALQIQ